MNKQKKKNKETIRYGNYEFRRELFKGKEHYFARPIGIEFWSESSKEVFDTMKLKAGWEKIQADEYKGEQINEKMIGGLSELIDGLTDKIQEIKNDIEEGRATIEELRQLEKERQEAIEDLNKRRRIAG